MTTNPSRRRFSRKDMDDAFPTVVRYMGIGLGLAWFGAALMGVYLPESTLVLVMGMLLYKTVKGNGNGRAP